MVLHTLIAWNYKKSSGTTIPRTPIHIVCSHLPRLMVVIWLATTVTGLVVISKQPTCDASQLTRSFWRSGTSCVLHRVAVIVAILALYVLLDYSHVYGTGYSRIFTGSQHWLFCAQLSFLCAAMMHLFWGCIRPRGRHEMEASSPNPAGKVIPLRAKSFSSVVIQMELRVIESYTGPTGSSVSLKNLFGLQVCAIQLQSGQSRS